MKPIFMKPTRQMQRARARLIMERVGIQHKNRKRGEGDKSFFAMNWRDYAARPKIPERPTRRATLRGAQL